MWAFDADDWVRLDDGAVWTTGRLSEAIAKSKARKRSTVLSFWGVS